MIFLQLAVCAKAGALVSGDKDILAVKRQLETIPILTVAEFAVCLAD
jgi:predicted nucleic acid-binding protein